MDNLDFDLTDETVVAFINTLRTIINQEIQAFLTNHNIEQFVDLKVVSVSKDGLTADLQDPVTKDRFDNVPNHTGIRLKAGDKGDFVRMYRTQNGDYIGLSFGDRTDGLYKDYVDSAIKTAVSKIK